MNNWIFSLLRALKEVYSRKQYYIYSLLFALFIFSLNPLLRNYKLLKAQFSWLLVLQLILASPVTSGTVPFVLLTILSILSGIVMAFSVYVIRRQISQGVNLGLTGVIIGIVAPACPSCALGIFGVLGLGGLLTILPFKGLELGFLGIFLLIISLLYLSKKIEAKVCVLPLKKGRKR
ncbi:hypothetical protein HYT55_03125 [Candidatus Woesearchaeota archaeon]|nr:hypothetical protein [Candidatus Woesearchaeota archaeon]